MADLISPDQPLHELFADVSWDDTDWEEACLGEVVLYMRLAKNVKVPRVFKPLIEKLRFPRDLPFLEPHQGPE